MSNLHQYGLFNKDGLLLCDTYAHDETEAKGDFLHLLRLTYAERFGLCADDVSVKMRPDLSENGALHIGCIVGDAGGNELTYESDGNTIHDMGSINNTAEHQRRCDEMYDRLLENGAYIFRAEYLEGVLEFSHEAAAEIAVRELYEYCWKETEL